MAPRCGDFQSYNPLQKCPIWRTERILSRMSSLYLPPLIVALFACLFVADAQAQGQTPRPTTPRPSAGNPGGTTPRTPPRTASAGTKTASGLTNQEQRPVVRPARISREMETLLQEWEEKSAKVTRLEGRFAKFTYDHAFGVEKRGLGTFCYQAPDKGSFHTWGAKVDSKAVSKFKTKSQEPYTVETDKGERWVCDGIQILKIEESEKTFEAVEIPAEDRGQNIIKTPLPFVFGMKAEQAKERYILELDSQRTTESYFTIRVIPLLRDDLQNYSRAEVMLLKDKFLPRAVKLWDPSGNTEIVYSFDVDNMKINQKGWQLWLSGDPLKPKLTSYKQVMNGPGKISTDGGNIPETKLAPVPKGVRSTAVPSTAPRKTAELPEGEDEAPLPRKNPTTGRARID